MTDPGGGAPDDDLELLLVDRARDGDEQAFAELVRRHQDRLFAVALRMIGDRQAAEEIVQDGLVQAWQHLSGFRAEARFSTWVTRIVINRCLNARRGRSPIAVPVQGQESQRPAEAAAEEVALRQQRRAAVRHAVASLPFDQRAALVLTAFAGHSAAEAARILGTSESTVKVRAHRGRRALVDRLREWR